MKWRRTLGASVLAFSILLPSTVAGASQFTDVGPRFEKEIDYLAIRNVVKGYNNGTFGVNKPVTRGEAVVMLVRELPIKFNGAPDPGFTDFKKGDGFFTEVAEAVQAGIINGKTAKDGSLSFDPTGNLTRAEMALILTRAYDIPLDRMNVQFKDVTSQMSAQKAINALANGGIAFGFDDGSFKPHSSITRQEFAAFLARTVNVEFNKMSLKLDQHDPVSGQRIKPVWLTDVEVREKEEELTKHINVLRELKGLPSLQKNEQLFEMARLKARAFSRFPHEEYVLTEYPIFYNKLYGEKLTKKIIENTAGGQVNDAIYKLVNNTMNEPSIYEKDQAAIGVGLAQNMDGSYNWFVLFMYK